MGVFSEKLKEGMNSLKEDALNMGKSNNPTKRISFQSRAFTIRNNLNIEELETWTHCLSVDHSEIIFQGMAFSGGVLVVMFKLID